MHTDHHREARRTAIVRLLRSSSVRRQQELVRLLKREGHAATQSSISRDLRELGVLKHSDGYVLPDNAEIAARTLFPDRTSSLIRSKMTTFASAATPIVRITPAKPGSVSVTPKSKIAA